MQQSQLAAVLATAAAPARSQEIPNLNLDPVCRGIAQQASTVAEKGSPDVAFSHCIQSEQAMRQKLAGKWSTFSPSEKANCIGAQMAGMVPRNGTRRAAVEPRQIKIVRCLSDFLI